MFLYFGLKLFTFKLEIIMKIKFASAFSLFFVVFFLAFTISCNNESFQSVLNESGDLSVENAKYWFEGTLKNARTGDNDKFLLREAVWDLALEYKFNTGSEVIVVPLSHILKDEKSGYKEAWFYKTKKNKIDMMITEYIGSWDNRNKFQNIRKNFSGLQIFRNWENEFLGGFVSENGKIMSAITEMNKQKMKSKKNARSGAELVCGTFQTCNYFSYYGWIPSTGYISPTTTVLTGCSMEYNCYFVDMSGINQSPVPVNTSGSGGTNAPPTPIPDPDLLLYDPAKSVKTFFTKCEGFSFVRGLANWYKKEIHGVGTTDGQIIVLPSINNTPVTTAWYNTYTNVEVDKTNVNSSNWGTVALDLDLKKITIYSNATGQVILEKTIDYTFHTHPCSIGGPLVFGDDPSQADINFASQYQNMNHWVWGCNWDTRYNQNGKVGTGNSQICPR